MMAIGSYTYPLMGAILGLTAGISPGPLLTLIIAQTLKHNIKEGIKIAIVPLLTDLPILITTLLVFTRISHFYKALSIISLLGGLFIAYLGYETLNTKGLDIGVQNLKPGSLKKGIIANFLNPNPYLFWLAIGTPIAYKAYAVNIQSVAFFFIFFYFALIGSAIVVALIVEKSRSFFSDKTYIWAMRILGLILFVFSVYFFYDAITLWMK